MRPCSNKLTTLAALQVIAAGRRLAVYVTDAKKQLFGFELRVPEELLFYRDNQLESRAAALAEIERTLLDALGCSHKLPGDLTTEHVKTLLAHLKTTDKVEGWKVLPHQA